MTFPLFKTVFKKEQQHTYIYIKSNNILYIISDRLLSAYILYFIYFYVINIQTINQGTSFLLFLNKNQTKENNFFSFLVIVLLDRLNTHTHDSFTPLFKGFFYFFIRVKRSESNRRQIIFILFFLKTKRKNRYLFIFFEFII